MFTRARRCDPSRSCHGRIYIGTVEHRARLSRTPSSSFVTPSPKAVTVGHSLHPSSLLPPASLKVSRGGKTKGTGVGRGDIVELYGPSGSGKSEVLINVVARCVMPAWLGGEEQPAVYFDNGELKTKLDVHS